MDNNYNDIINLPRHVSNNHPQMSNRDRAAQFSPFAALTGYHDIIQESARTTEKKKELSENQIVLINEKLLLLSECENTPMIRITYFQKDKKKVGGKYIQIEGKIKRIDDLKKTLILQDGRAILLDDIIDIQSEIFINY